MKYLVVIHSRGNGVYGTQYVVTSSTKCIAKHRNGPWETLVYALPPKKVATHPITPEDLDVLCGQKPIRIHTSW